MSDWDQLCKDVSDLHAQNVTLTRQLADLTAQRDELVKACEISLEIIEGFFIAEPLKECIAKGDRAIKYPKELRALIARVKGQPKWLKKDLL